MTRGRVWKFGHNINTDLILPGSVIRSSEAEQARAVFAANRPGWVDEVHPGDIIVAGRNFGMGSSRPAARSLRNIGIACVLADSINGLFFRNSVNYGLLAIACPQASVLFEEEGQVAEIDPAVGLVRNVDTGAEARALSVPGRLLALMLGGGILPVLEKEGLIAPAAAPTALQVVPIVVKSIPGGDRT